MWVLPFRPDRLAVVRAVGLDATVPYELGVDEAQRLRVTAAFDELKTAI